MQQSRQLKGLWFVKITQLRTSIYHGLIPLVLSQTDPFPKTEGWVDIVSFSTTFQGKYISHRSLMQKISDFSLGLKCGRKPSTAHSSCWICNDIHSQVFAEGLLCGRHCPRLCRYMVNKGHEALPSQSSPATGGPKDIVQQFQHCRVKVLVEFILFICTEPCFKRICGSRSTHNEIVRI